MVYTTVLKDTSNYDMVLCFVVTDAMFHNMLYQLLEVHGD